MARLVVKEGALGNSAMELTGPRFSLGRAPDNDAQLQNRTVSRYHAVLIERPEGWYISDVGSHNDTVVNGSPIMTAKLSHGDEIRLGNVLLAFLEDGAEEHEQPLAARSEGPLEITQTVSMRELEGLDAAARDASAGGPLPNQRLRVLLALTEFAISVRNVEAICDGVARVLHRTLRVDRAILIIEEEDQGLRPFLEAKHRFGGDLEDLDVDTAILDKCRRERVAAAWRSAGPVANVACAPIRMGARNLGFVYCDRADPSAEFTGHDLRYLLAVAMQAAAAIENVRCYQQLNGRARSL
ncbi:MAG: FHA domain-containing protein, partial [Planctomycetota bacterium]